MKTEDHLSDTEIQLYALDDGSQGHTVAAHIAHCAHCSGRAAWYQRMAGSISAIPGETFDFELAPAVLAQLPVPKPRHTPELVFVACISIIGIMTGIGIFYCLNIIVLSETLWSNRTIIYGFVATCGLLFLFLTANLWREYISKVRELDAQRLQQYPGAAV